MDFYLSLHLLLLLVIFRLYGNLNCLSFPLYLHLVDSRFYYQSDYRLYGLRFLLGNTHLHRATQVYELYIIYDLSQLPCIRLA